MRACVQLGFALGLLHARLHAVPDNPKRQTNPNIQNQQSRVTVAGRTATILGTARPQMPPRGTIPSWQTTLISTLDPSSFQSSFSSSRSGIQLQCQNHLYRPVLLIRPPPDCAPHLNHPLHPSSLHLTSLHFCAIDIAIAIAILPPAAAAAPQHAAQRAQHAEDSSPISHRPSSSICADGAGMLIWPPSSHLIPTHTLDFQ